MSVDQVIATAFLAAAELCFLVSAGKLAPLVLKLVPAGLFLTVMPVLLFVAGAISVKGL